MKVGEKRENPNAVYIALTTGNFPQIQTCNS